MEWKSQEQSKPKEKQNEFENKPYSIKYNTD